MWSLKEKWMELMMSFLTFLFTYLWIYSWLHSELYWITFQFVSTNLFLLNIILCNSCNIFFFPLSCVWLPWALRILFTYLYFGFYCLVYSNPNIQWSCKHLWKTTQAVSLCSSELYFLWLAHLVVLIWIKICSYFHLNISQ